MIAKESRKVVRARKHARVRAKVTGTAEKPRLCVFRSNKHIEAQIIDDVKGVTLVASSSVALKLPMAATAKPLPKSVPIWPKKPKPKASNSSPSTVVVTSTMAASPR